MKKKSSKNEIKKFDQVHCIFLSQLIIILLFLKDKGFYNKGGKSSTGLFCGHRKQSCAFENHLSKTVLYEEELKEKFEEIDEKQHRREGAIWFPY